MKNKVANVGGDIFIHGRNHTIGCVPIGDQAIEELFYIVSQVGVANTQVIIAPSRLPLPTLQELNLNPQDELLIEKYARITAALTELI
jgi:murein L,D-transpeptidase YafK